MNKDKHISNTDFLCGPEWVMEQLESYLINSELSGEGDLPPWVTF